MSATHGERSLFYLAMKIVRHHANGRFDWLISDKGHQSFKRSNFHSVWEIQKIYVCPSCVSKALLNYS